MPDDGRTVTVAADRSARIGAPLPLGPAGQELIDLAKRAAPRCLTAVQRQQYHLTFKQPSWCEAMQKWP